MGLETTATLTRGEGTAEVLSGFSKTQSEALGRPLVFQLAIPAHDTAPKPLHLQEAVLEAQSNRPLLAKS